MRRACQAQETALVGGDENFLPVCDFEWKAALADEDLMSYYSYLRQSVLPNSPPRKLASLTIDTGKSRSRGRPNQNYCRVFTKITRSIECAKMPFCTRSEGPP
jgi:hypothetical protein